MNQFDLVGLAIEINDIKVAPYPFFEKDSVLVELRIIDRRVRLKRILSAASLNFWPGSAARLPLVGEVSGSAVLSSDWLERHRLILDRNMLRLQCICRAGVVNFH